MPKINRNYKKNVTDSVGSKSNENVNFLKNYNMIKQSK